MGKRGSGGCPEQDEECLYRLHFGYTHHYFTSQDSSSPATLGDEEEPSEGPSYDSTLEGTKNSVTHIATWKEMLIV